MYTKPQSNKKRANFEMAYNNPFWIATVNLYISSSTANMGNQSPPSFLAC